MDELVLCAPLVIMRARNSAIHGFTRLPSSESGVYWGILKFR